MGRSLGAGDTETGLGEAFDTDTAVFGARGSVEGFDFSLDEVDADGVTDGKVTEHGAETIGVAADDAEEPRSKVRRRQYHVRCHRP